MRGKVSMWSACINNTLVSHLYPPANPAGELVNFPRCPTRPVGFKEYQRGEQHHPRKRTYFEKECIRQIKKDHGGKRKWPRLTPEKSRDNKEIKKQARDLVIKLQKMPTVAMLFTDSPLPARECIAKERKMIQKDGQWIDVTSLEDTRPLSIK